MNPSMMAPEWEAPRNVEALSTLRTGGVSITPFASLNLGLHVGDDPLAVETNRQRVSHLACLPREPFWLDQVHGTRVLRLGKEEHKDHRADAAYTDQAGQVCTVMTADCLPVLFCSLHGNEVAAAHAGWRGLCAGILEETVRCFKCSPSEIVAWLGPAIGPSCFEVGEEVRAHFVKYHPQAAQAFTPLKEKYLADIYLLARQRLTTCGVAQIFGGGRCTFTESDVFFSYRREGITGRMASMVWFN